MPTWRPAFDEWLSTHQGIISGSRLQTLGCSPRTASRMVARGDLIVMQPGVFRSRQWPAGVEQRLGAICARNPRAVIAFTTAASLWGFRRVDDKRVHVLVPHGSSPALDGAVVHRCRRIDDVDIVERRDGIRITSPPRTLFDSADLLGISAARSVMEQILNEKMCGLGTIIDTFTRLAHPQRPGTATMAAVIASRPKWRRALQSDLEQKVLEEIERQHLPLATTQCPVELPSGTVIHLDFGWPSWKVGLEVDDPTWHAGIEESHRDAHRDRKAATVGWLVPRVSRLDVEGALAEAIGDISAILGRRGWVA